MASRRSSGRLSNFERPPLTGRSTDRRPCYPVDYFLEGGARKIFCQVDPPPFVLSLQVGIVFLANSVRIRKPARSRSPLRFRQAPKAQQKPQLAKTAGSFPVFSFSDYCHGCCHGLPDHDRISLTTEPVQALSIVRVAHCWKRCPRLPLPRLQDPLRPGQIRGSCAEDRTCLAITYRFRIHHGLADAAHGPTLRASFGEERKTKHPRARPAHQRAQLGA